MILRLSLLSFLGAASLAACGPGVGADPAAQRFRSYDLKITHPAPYATFVAISPGAPGAPMPKLRHLGSRDFSRYLMARTGCTVDPHHAAEVIGDPRVPAGYMVPVRCMP
ncbi:MAG: hypothetical protein AAGA28_10860 [Pseudomonadota bacterium]